MEYSYNPKDRVVQAKLFLCKTLRFMQHGIEVNSHLHAAGALSLGKELSVRIKQESS